MERLATSSKLFMLYRPVHKSLEHAIEGLIISHYLVHTYLDAEIKAPMNIQKYENNFALCVNQRSFVQVLFKNDQSTL